MQEAQCEAQRAAFLAKRSFAVFLPLKMSYVAKQCVVMSWLVRELAHRHKAMTASQKLGELRHLQRGFYGFCKKSKYWSFLVS
jgi:hypothetical protein